MSFGQQFSSERSWNTGATSTTNGYQNNNPTEPYSPYNPNVPQYGNTDPQRASVDSGFGGEQADLIERSLGSVVRNRGLIKQALNTIGTSMDTREFRQQTKSLIRETKQLSISALRKIESLGGGGSKPQTRRKVQKIAGDFSKLKDTVESEIAFLEEEMARKPPKKARAEVYNPSGDITAVPYDDREDDDERAVLLDRQTQIDSIEHEVTFMDNVIKERNQEITAIQSDMAQVNEIMREIATIVNEQGQMIDNIEMNVESTHQNTSEAKAEVQKAAKYQKKARNKMCILAIVTVVVVLIVVIVVVIVIPKK